MFFTFITQFYQESEAALKATQEALQLENNDLRDKLAKSDVTSLSSSTPSLFFFFFFFVAISDIL